MAERLTGWENGWNAKQEPLPKTRREKIVDYLLNESWPAQVGKAALGAFTLPGDVYAGRVDPMSIEAIQRSADLGGLLALGATAAPRGALGSGAVRPPKPPANMVEDGMRVFRGGSQFAPSHAGRYGKSKAFSVSPNRDIAAKYGDVVEGSLPPTAKIMELDKAFVDDVDIRRAKMQGYDAIKPIKSSEDELIILRPDLVQTASPPPEGIRAYHGSPHDFDKFDMSKIGTGEGAQSYGHGLYFAENPAVASEYKNTLGKRNIEWASPDAATKYDPFTLTAIQRELQKGQTPEQIMAMNAQYSKLKAEGRPTLMADMHDALANKDISVGKMYETRINASPDEFLDWDKPLSEQPEKVRKALESALTRAALKREPQPGVSVDLDKFAGSFSESGAGLYNLVTAWAQRDPRGATEALRAAGIKGIRYKDQGSRTIDPPTEMMSRAQDLAAESTRLRSAFEKSPTKEIAERFDAVTAEQKVLADKIAAYRGANETRNYVVFDDSIIEILRKYGIAGLIGGAAGAGAMGGEAKASPNAGERQDRRKQALLNAIGK